MLVLASMIAVIVVAGGGLLLLRHARPAGARAAPAAEQLLTPDHSGGFTIKQGGTITQVSVLAGSVYVVWHSSGRAAGFELARIDPKTGRVLAARLGRGSFGFAALIGGALWWTRTVGNASRRLTTIVTRSNPRSLTRLSSRALAGVTYGGELNDGTLADTGQWTWVSDASGIDRFSSQTGQYSGLRIPIRSAFDGPLPVGTPAGPGGLVVFVTHEPRGMLAGGVRVQQRDPTTGAIEGGAGYPHSRDFAGVQVAGVVGRQAWVLWGSPLSGVLGTVNLGAKQTSRRIDVRLHLTPESVATIAGNRLWIAPRGFGARIDCVDVVTGRVLGAVQLANAEVFLAADRTSVYTLAQPHTGPARLAITKTPAACRG
jgi:hypothetical protein